MKKHAILTAGLLALLCANSWAARVGIGIVVPVGPLYASPYYAAPYPYYPAPYYYQPPVVVQAAPQPQLQVAPQTTAPTWYYCNESKTYYPYVQSCPSGWTAVPATPQNTPPNS